MILENILKMNIPRDFHRIVDKFQVQVLYRNYIGFSTGRLMPPPISRM